MIASSLDSMFIGLVPGESNGVKQIFAFLNYDFLETVLLTPDKKNDKALFCINNDTQLYPINDINPNAKLKWATIDELLFEQKILGENVEQNIFDVFYKNENLWNIDMDGKNIDFPFVVYAVKKTNDEFTTVSTMDENASFMKNGKIEEYGPSEETGDEYNDRYCFTLTPFNSTNSSIRYAMFAWDTRYIVTDDPLGTPEVDDQDEPIEIEDTQPQDENEEYEKDEIENEKLNFPTIYTITNNSFTKSVPTVMWGVLNNKQFVGL